MCPMCGCDEANELGRLGALLWVRCRACGAEYHIDPDAVVDAVVCDEVKR